MKYFVSLWFRGIKHFAAESYTDVEHHQTWIKNVCTTLGGRGADYTIDINPQVSMTRGTIEQRTDQILKDSNYRNLGSLKEKVSVDKETVK